MSDVPTHLVGGQEAVEKIASLEEQLAQARRAKESAEADLRAAKSHDIEAAAEGLRAGATNGAKATEPAAEKKWNAAERHLTVVTLALRKEREALTADILGRRSDIVASLVAREDQASAEIDEALETVVRRTAERDELRATRTWLDADCQGTVGQSIPRGAREVEALRVALAPNVSATYAQAAKRDIEVWNAFVERAVADVRRVPDPDGGFTEYTHRRDNAIEDAWLALPEEERPKPTAEKWQARLGTGNWSKMRATV